jgi:transposase-like protein
LAVDGSWSRSILATMLSIREVSGRCANRPFIVVDGGPWYPPALQEHGCPHRHERFGMLNAIKSWFSVLKHGTKRFYNYSPWEHLEERPKMPGGLRDNLQSACVS